MRPWEANVRKVVPYVPGEQPKGGPVIKLNTNENPYPPAPGVEKLLKEMDYSQFKKYPDPGASVLVEALAAHYGIPVDQIFVGVGSDDVIAMSFLTFFNSSKPILFPDITYSFYQVWADLFRIPYEKQPLTGDFRIVPEDYCRSGGGIIFPNPNAPTGVYLPLEQVEKIVSSNPDVIVIVDEAYIDFGGESALGLTDRYDNLLVVQTFSKSRSMAGMRIGFAVGNPDLIRALNDVKFSFNSYTMNLPSQLLGAESVRDDGYFRETVGRIVQTRQEAKRRLAGLGFTFPDSYTNFLFVKHESCPAGELFEALRRERIYVRYFNQDKLNQYLRITIGSEPEMEALYQFLEEYLSKR